MKSFWRIPMANIDEGKMQKLAEAAGWIEQARKYYAAWMWEVADSCVVRAQAALNDQCFKRQPIPNFSRDQQPAVLWVKNPLTGAKKLIHDFFRPLSIFNLRKVWQ